MRKRAFSQAPWESKVGYCRAIRAGNHVYVTGTASVAEDGSVFAPGDPGAQAERCFALIEKALIDCGAEIKHVVRTRIFVTNIDQWEPIGAAHARVFRDHPPATTMVEVSRLIDPAMLVEIEADAVIA